MVSNHSAGLETRSLNVDLDFSCKDRSVYNVKTNKIKDVELQGTCTSGLAIFKTALNVVRNAKVILDI
jgi:hypothetical protein